jgi:uncharacterized protein (TIGR02391 family)
MGAIPEIDATHLQEICNVLGDTATGLTGTEIADVLSACGVADPGPFTKRIRLFQALQDRQRQDMCANNVLAVVRRAMDPVRYTRDVPKFEARRAALNKVLSFSGWYVRDDGELTQSTPARTLTEAEERAGRLRGALEQRGVHPDVLRFCRPELLDGNYFHAVLEATKSVAEKIRVLTGLTGDGSPLVDEAFTFNGVVPYLALSALRTETEQMEQRGFMNLMKGVFGTFRNPAAHAPRISWQVSEQDALDLLTLASYMHRRLDAAVRTPRQAP